MIPPSDDRSSGRPVLEGGFRILRSLPDADVARQVASLAELTSLPRPTVYRLLGQLRQIGAVDLGADGLWEVSPSLLSVTRRAEPVSGLRQVAMKVMQALRHQTGAAVSLVVPTGTSFVALEMIPGREDLPIDACAGADMPDTTAAGLLLGSTKPSAGRFRPFGAAVDNEDVLDGLTCFAKLLALPRGRLACLQIATSTRRTAETFAPEVRRAATALDAVVAQQTAWPRS